MVGGECPEVPCTWVSARWDYPYIGKPGVTYSYRTDGLKTAVFKLESMMM